jgi:hypothetical protein
MGFLREFYGVLMGFLCGSYAIPCYFYDLSMGFLWDPYGISTIFLCDYYGMAIESKLKSFENKFKLNNQMKIN